jgi:thioredoxin reductase/ferredoxin
MTLFTPENLVIYFIFLSVIWFFYLGKRFLKGRRSTAVKKEEFDAGLTEPASLHPVIDQTRCMGCGSCVTACPEQQQHPVLGLINGKAELIAPTNCIGHGACKTACPFEAITLVFGTEKRGVDLPLLSPEFETSMPGIYIAGELGGMGLIRNAVEQGRQAMDAITKALKGNAAHPYEVVIIGAGPAGFTASLYAHEKKMRYKTLEQDSLGGAVFKFPRRKLVMTTPVELPMVGKVKFTETTKEELLSFWQDVEEKTGVEINYQEKVASITPIDSGYLVTTTKGSYQTRAILLTIGRHGTPRKLGVEGDHLSKVVYRLIDPEQYRNQQVLVVGGGDSALEAAVSISEQPGTHVILSYRGDAFTRAKKKNREKVEKAKAADNFTLLMKSNVKSFTTESVSIEQNNQISEYKNDAAIVCAGGILPTGFLKEIGITVETKHGTA